MNSQSDLWYSWTLWERKWWSWIPSICICLSVDSMIFLRSSEVTFFVTEHFPKCVMNQTLIDPCSLNKSECHLTLIVIPLIEYLTFTFKLSPYTWDSHICCSRICNVLSLFSIRTMYYFFNLLLFDYYQYLCENVIMLKVILMKYIKTTIKGLQPSNDHYMHIFRCT